MSKTVKMIPLLGLALLTILGTRAEAHYIVMGGRCYWHSGQCVRQDEDVPPPPAPINDILITETIARPGSVEILCPGSPLPIVKQFNLSNDGVTLVVQQPIAPGNITERRDPNTGKNISTNLEWDGVISDAIFLEDPKLSPKDPQDFNFCSGLVPLDTIIRSMSVEMNLYLKADPTTSHSTWKGTCALSNKFSFTNFPKNVPPRGVAFDCSTTERCHLKECVKP